MAFQALYAWETGGQSPEELALLPWLEEEKRSSLDPETIAFSRFLILGVTEQVQTLDDWISASLDKWTIKRLSKVDLAILRLGAYSLMYQRDVPATITIDEAVEIAKEYSSTESFRFVNGVLDAIRARLEEGSTAQ